MRPQGELVVLQREAGRQVRHRDVIFVLKLKSTREPLGVIILEGCTVELAEEETDVFAFKVKFVLEMITD